jgi:hypothetical protein
MKQIVLSANNMPNIMYNNIAITLNEKCKTQNPGWAAVDKNLGTKLLVASISTSPA